MNFEDKMQLDGAKRERAVIGKHLLREIDKLRQVILTTSLQQGYYSCLQDILKYLTKRDLREKRG